MPKISQSHQESNQPEDTNQNSPDANPLTQASSDTAEFSINQNQDEIIDLLKRTRADFENFRKRTEEQKSLAIKLSAQKTTIKFLPLLDVFRLAINNDPNLSPLEKTLQKTLKNLNLEFINPALGSNFDPNLHEALSMEEGEGDNEVISELLRPGYIYESEVIRPALVKVKKV